MYLFDKRKENTQPFRSIKIGETFFDSENKIHAMKILFCEDDDGCVNAINLESGEGLFYEDNEEIIATKAKVEIFA